MGVFDNIGDQIAKNQDKIDDAIERGGDVVDSKTGNKYAEHVDKGQDLLRDKSRDFGDSQESTRGDGEDPTRQDR